MLLELCGLRLYAVSIKLTGTHFQFDFSDLRSAVTFQTRRECSAVVPKKRSTVLGGGEDEEAV